MSSSGAPPTRVAVIEDQRDIREGLASLINGAGGFQITGAFGSMESALPALSKDPPEILLLDIGLPGMSGIEGIPILRERCPRSLILVLSVYDDDDRIFSALCAGASGYLLKNTAPVKLLESLAEAVSGGSPMSPEVARRVVLLFRKFSPPEKADYDLSPHESRLLRLLAEGHSYRGAAGKLGLSVNTIAFHMKRIYEKLHVHSKSQAVAKAFRQGLVR
jgi:DNA-binding NarL/FixJ family response regulator